MTRILLLFAVLLFGSGSLWGVDIKTTPLYARIKSGLDAVPAIDTHDHLRPFGEMSQL